MKALITIFLILFITSSLANDCPPADDKHKYIDTPIDFENPIAGTYKLHYKLQNLFDKNKKTLFLLHGGPGEGMGAFDLCPGGYCFNQFKNEYNIIAIDERGAGCSLPPKASHSKHTTIIATAEDIEFLKNYLVGKEGKVSIFGVSFGTVVGIVMAARHPDSIERLVLEGSLADNSYQERLPENIAKTYDILFNERPDLRELNHIVEDMVKKGELKMSFEEFREMRDVFALYSYSLAWNVFPKLLKELNNKKYDLYDKLEAALVSATDVILKSPAYMYIMCREIVSFTAEPNRFTVEVQDICKDFQDENPSWNKWNALDYTTQISVPTLIITGKSDSVTAPYNGEILNQNITDSKFFTIPFAGHGVLWENPKCDLALISDFFSHGINNNLDVIFQSDICQKI